MRFISDSDLLKFSGSQEKSDNKRISLSRESKYHSQAKYIIHATRNGDFATVKSYIKKGISIDSHDFAENTALTDVADRGDLGAVGELLDLSVDPYASCDCSDHNTALHYAAKRGHNNVVKYLLDYGVDPNVYNGNFKTPLELVLTSETKKIIHSYDARIPVSINNIKFSEDKKYSLCENDTNKRRIQFIGRK